MLGLLLKIIPLIKNNNESLERTLQSILEQKILCNIAGLFEELTNKNNFKYRENRVENLIDKKIFGFIKINMQKKIENLIYYLLQFFKFKKIDSIL